MGLNHLQESVLLVPVVPALCAPAHTSMDSPCRGGLLCSGQLTVLLIEYLFQVS